MNGLLFPGQGSQAAGMGRELYESLPQARKLLDTAEDILDFDIRKLMFEGPQELLNDTRYTQPVVYVCSAMYLEKVRADGIPYDYAAGHSLGEYDALLAAGVYRFEDGLRLVAKRGQAMGEKNGEGTMAAVLGLTEEELRPYMESGAVMANLNSKTQIVVSGTIEAVDKIGEKLSSVEGAKFRKLKVSAAFHSPQMLDAARVMTPVIESVAFHTPSCYVVSNVTGKATKDPEEIRRNLISQITGQVRWYDTIMTMKEAGVTQLYEVGYGNVLQKLNKTITFKPKCLSVL